MTSHDREPTSPAPNHHAGFGRFQGPKGYLLALRFLFGRGADARLACRLGDLGRDDVLVDVGCGPGVAARTAARTCRRVVGVDPAGPMLAIARRLGTKRVDYELGFAEALPLPDGSCTVAWSLATAHHWADVDKGLSEARRVLTSGGRLLVMERYVQPASTGHHSHGWTGSQADAFRERASAMGFASVAWSTHQSRRGRVVVVLTARV